MDYLCSRYLDYQGDNEDPILGTIMIPLTPLNTERLANVIRFVHSGGSVFSHSFSHLTIAFEGLHFYMEYGNELDEDNKKILDSISELLSIDFYNETDYWFERNLPDLPVLTPVSLEIFKRENLAQTFEKNSEPLEIIESYYLSRDYSDHSEEPHSQIHLIATTFITSIYCKTLKFKAVVEVENDCINSIRQFQKHLKRDESLKLGGIAASFNIKAIFVPEEFSSSIEKAFSVGNADYGAEYFIGIDEKEKVEFQNSRAKNIKKLPTSMIELPATVHIRVSSELSIYGTYFFRDDEIAIHTINPIDVNEFLSLFPFLENEELPSC